jgi:hypothetical protein
MSSVSATPITTVSDLYFGDGSFEFVNDKHYRTYLQSAHNAITICELWEWFQRYSPDPNRGFSWSTTPELDKLSEQMRKDPYNGNHSGSSYSIIMRDMEYIAKNGYDSFAQDFLSED